MNRTNATLTNARKLTSSGLSNLSPKAMAAVVLMGMMVILWGRVLLRGKGGPEAADAQSLVQEQAGTAAAAETPVPAAIRIGRVELSQVPGRHDRLTNDIFSSGRWTAFNFHGPRAADGPVRTVDSGQLEEKTHLANLDALARELKLEAVIEGTDGRGMQAFIDGKILTAGQVLTVRRQSQVYELTVAEISPQQALLKWNTYSIQLKITESQEQ